MTDTPNATPDPSEGDTPDHLKEMRERAERYPLAEKLAAAATLELKLFKEGIDVSTRAGQGWLHTFNGDIGDVETVRSDWAAFSGGAAPAPVETDAPPAIPTEGVGGEYRTGMTDDIRTNMSGPGKGPGLPDEGPNPYERAKIVQQEALLRDVPADRARQAGLMEIMGAASRGDRSVLWTEQEREAWNEQGMI